MIIAAHQPNYLPWIGFFHKMNTADVFIIMDNVQFIRRSFTYRTKILGPHGVYFHTIPVNYNYGNKINEVLISEQYSARKLLETIKHFYAKTPNFSMLEGELHEIFKKKFYRLFDLNLELIYLVKRILNITTRIVFSSDLNASGSKTDLLANYCRELGADTYLSGNGAMAYIQDTIFAENNIKLVYQAFQHPVYPQRSNEFVPGLSIIDFIFNCRDYPAVFKSI